MLSYGPGGGYAPLREWIAERHGVEPARVVITSGSLQGFVFLAEQLVHQGSRVLVEAPTYDRPLKILTRLGADIVGLPMDDDGLRSTRSSKRSRRARSRRSSTRSPRSRTRAGGRSRRSAAARIAELAREHDLLVLEDDPYGLVRYEGARSDHLRAGGRQNVAYASSFSKTIAPGVRVGYFVLRRRSQRRSRRSRSRRTSRRRS